MERSELARRVVGAWRVAGSSPADADIRVGADALPAGVSAAVAQALRAALAERRVPGAQVAVRRGGAALWSAAAGRVDREAPVQPADRFVLASATKPVVACLVALLAERGALRLDQLVSAHVPGLPHADTLSIRMLLAHRSGLRDHTRDRTIARRMNGGDPTYPWARAELLEAIARRGPDRGPDRRFAYRNANYVVAAEVAERAGGKPIGALLDELVGAPLRIPGLAFERATPGARLATPHLVVAGRAVDLLAVNGGVVPNDAIGPVWGDGGIASCADDLATFTEALLVGDLVHRVTRTQLTARWSGGSQGGYGLGLMLRAHGGGHLIGHDGLYFGWSASTGADTVTGTVVSVVANAAAPSVPAARIARAVRRALEA